MLRHLIGVAMALSIVAVAGHATSAGNCATAQAEVRRAQTDLSAAVRESDARGAAYHACMQRNDNDCAACKPEREALDVAVQRKRGASDAFRFAVARAKQVCG